MSGSDNELLAAFEAALGEAPNAEQEWLTLTAGAERGAPSEWEHELEHVLAEAEYGLRGTEEEAALLDQELEQAVLEEQLVAEEELEAAAQEEEIAPPRLDSILDLAKQHPGLRITVSFSE